MKNLFLKKPSGYEIKLLEERDSERAFLQEGIGIILSEVHAVTDLVLQVGEKKNSER